MALRFSEEPVHRLSPREARQFLQVHAEREAASTMPDAPTVHDLAEALGITSDEACSILREARARTAAPKSKPRTVSQQEAHIATIILACAGIAAGSFFVFAPRPRSVPAPAFLPAENLSPATPPAGVPPTLMVEPPAPVPIRTPRPAFTPPFSPSVVPPANFMVQVESPGGSFGTNGPILGDAPDYRTLSAAEAVPVQSALVATVLDLVRPVPAERWGGVKDFSLSIMRLGGGRTKLVVPLGPGVDPETMRASLTKVVAAAWSQIVR